MGNFGQKSSPTDVLKAILLSYPLGIGLFRELLQNSDDAYASIQVSGARHRPSSNVLTTWPKTFILDYRTHATQSNSLRFANGPALLAYNNARVTEVDWVALQEINRSSKKADTRYASG